MRIKNGKLKDLQKECFNLDGYIRWLAALISDTGMRLSEAVCLLVDDLVVESEIHISNFLLMLTGV